MLYEVITTRTFPVKMSLKNPGFLAQGMEARVTLPTGPAEDSYNFV